MKRIERAMGTSNANRDTWRAKAAISDRDTWRAKAAISAVSGLERWGNRPAQLVDI